MVFSPGEFSSLIDSLGEVECDHSETPHPDIVDLLNASGPCGGKLAAVLVRYLQEHSEGTPEVRCVNRYREWSVRVARFSFETYQKYRPV
jgi:hypothetical protein